MSVRRKVLFPDLKEISYKDELATSCYQGLFCTSLAGCIWWYVIVTDMNGSVLKKTNLFELNDCISDVDYYAHTHGVISKELVITSSIEVIECGNKKENCDTTRTCLEKNIR